MTKWLKIANRVLIMVLLLLNAAQAETVQIRSYVLPTYPGRYNRAGLEGTFLVEVEAKKGRVKRVEIISHKVISPPDIRVENPTEMIEGIKEALSQWQFTQPEPKQDFRFRLTIVFQLRKSFGETISDSSEIGYVYTIQEKKMLPSEIIVEANWLGAGYR